MLFKTIHMKMLAVMYRLECKFYVLRKRWKLKGALATVSFLLQLELVHNPGRQIYYVSAHLFYDLKWILVKTGIKSKTNIVLFSLLHFFFTDFICYIHEDKKSHNMSICFYLCTFTVSHCWTISDWKKQFHLIRVNKPFFNV